MRWGGQAGRERKRALAMRQTWKPWFLVAIVGAGAASAAWWAREVGPGHARSSMRPNERGRPWIILEDAGEVPTVYVGPLRLREALERGLVRPMALASADFDEDGMPDLVSGYAGPSGSLLTLHRGNAISLWPPSGGVRTGQAVGRSIVAPFWPEARVVALPEPPDFLGAGDFDADGHADVITAARGGRVLHLVRGDGRGGFQEQREIALPGQVTTLVVGEMNRADGLADIAVGIVARDGPHVLIFESPEGAVYGEPEPIPLPDEAMALALGQLDERFEFDLAVAAGPDVLIVHGRDRYWGSSDHASALISSIHRGQRSFVALAVGDFLWDETQGLEIAALGEDGVVRVFARRSASHEASLHSRATTASWAVVATWSDADLSAHASSRISTTRGQLIRAKISSLPGDDLLVLPSRDRQWHILASLVPSEGSTNWSWGRSLPLSGVTSFDADLVAVLPMRLNADALNDVVVLREGGSRPSIIRTASHATFVVNDTGDAPDANPGDGLCATSTGACTLRAAIQEANAHLGADAIHFDIPGPGPHAIVPGSALPTITEPVTIDATMENACGKPRCVELNGTSAGSSTDGLHIAAGSSAVRGLAINRFRRYGIRVETSGGNVIEGNFIGTDLDGMTDLGNSNDGIRIDGAPANTIGGTVAWARNVISGNNNDGIEVNGSGASGNVVRGNFIGTKANGTEALGNTQRGVFINGAPNNVIGGTMSGARNVISGSTANDGVEITGSAASGNLVQGSFIGTDVMGASDLGNDTDGVRLTGTPNNMIGGTVAGARNVISGNGSDGVEINGEASDANVIVGNYIGLAAHGASAVPNDGDGVRVSAGADAAIIGPNNVISGNGSDGVEITGSATTNARVQGNLIGTEATGATAVGNAGHGVHISSAANANTIGGASAGNIIAFNTGDGVRVASGTGNRVQQNSIFSNGGLGIDLGGDGVTANDTGDPDVGANNVQNFPVLTGVFSGPGTTIVHGSVDSALGNAAYPILIEFFREPSCDPSGHGEGRMFVGSVSVSAPGAFAITFSMAIPSGEAVTATATDANGNTSEFSACANVQQAAELIVRKVMVGGVAAFAFTGTPSGSIAVNAGTLAAVVAPGTYTSTEGTLSGWDLIGISCDDNDSTGDVGTRTATFRAAAGERITCTFTNVRRGRIIVRKDVVPDEASLWQITVTGQAPQTIGDGGAATFDDLVPGGYTVSESGPSGYVGDVNCGSKGSASSTSFSFTLNAGETVVCTFTNRKLGRIVVRKVTDPSPDPTETRFIFSGTVAGSARNGETVMRDHLAPGTYAVTETMLPQFELVAIACDDRTSPHPSVGDVERAAAIVRLDPGETVTCTFINRLKRANLVAVAFLSRPEAMGAAVRLGASAASVSGVIVVDPAQDRVRVFLSREDGTLRPGQIVLVGRGPVAAAVGDLNGDGASDIITADFQSRTLTILEGVGDGTFRRRRTLAVPAKPIALVVRDFDRDGRSDVLVAYPEEDAIQIFHGRGDFTVAAGRRLSVGRRPMALAVADFNGDELLDVIVANAASDSVTVLLGRGDGTFAPGDEVLVGQEPVALTVNDFDGDGWVDAATANFRASTLSLVRNEGMVEGRIRLRVVATIPTAEGPMALVSGRFFGDGMGIVSAGSLAQQVWWHALEGDRRWSVRQRMNVHIAPMAIVSGDLNGDGRADLIVLEAMGERLQVWLATEAGVFQRHQ